MPSKKIDKKDWKRFEERIGRLETMLGNPSIRVKINDSIVDSGGSVRQIDASVRVNTGTTELLYIIECRNRKKVDDVTWVEQVATKRNRVGAVKAILVSNKPLTKSAMIAAQGERIDVRTLEEIDGSILENPPRLAHFRIDWSPATVNIMPETPTAVLPEHREKIQGLGQGEPSDVLFSFSNREGMKTFAELVEEVYAAYHEVSFPPGEKGGTAIIEMCVPGTKVEMIIDDMRYPMRRLTFTAQGTVVEVASVRNYLGQYQAPGGSIDHIVAEQTVQLRGEDVTITAVQNSSDKGVTVNIPYNFLNEDVREGIDKELGVNVEVFFDENNKPQFRVRK